jgi:hypothetical protein
LWEAWKLSQAYHRPPSEIYRIKDELTGWSFDRAVWVFGSTVESELEAAAHSAKKPQQQMFKQQQVLAKYKLAEMKFRDPMAAANVKKPQADPNAVVTSEEAAGPVQL